MACMCIKNYTVCTNISVPLDDIRGFSTTMRYINQHIYLSIYLFPGGSILQWAQVLLSCCTVCMGRGLLCLHQLLAVDMSVNYCYISMKHDTLTPRHVMICEVSLVTCCFAAELRKYLLTKTVKLHQVSNCVE